MPARPIAHWLLLACLVAMWGSSFAFTAVALTALPNESIVFLRLVLGVLVLFGFFLALGRRFPANRRLWGFFVVMGLTGNALPFWLITWGQQSIDSGLAGILMSIMPLTTLVLAHFFVAGERLTLVRLGGFALGFVGIVVLIGPQALLELQGQGTALLAELAVLGATLCYAINTIIARRRPPSDAVVAATGTMMFALLLVAPFGLATPIPVADVTWSAGLALAFLGVVSTALATMLYFKLITAAGPTFVSLINYLIPLWALLVGVVFLNETPQWTALIGLVFILSGIAISESRRRS